jgi:hypothetical protein
VRRNEHGGVRRLRRKRADRVVTAAADLPLGALVVSGATVLRKTAKLAHPWQVGTGRRFLADWRVDEAIAAGASVVRPDKGGTT